MARAHVMASFVRARHRLRRKGAITAGLLLAAAVLWGWAVSSPVGSAPDDDFHLTSVWCAESASTSQCRTLDAPDARSVPELVAEAAHCYRWDPTTSAACQRDEETSASFVETSRGNFSPQYPPVYYAIMNVFVQDDVAQAAMVMRGVNAAVFLLLTLTVFLLVPERRRRELVLAWIVGSVPLGLFLLASNNPSGWATMGVVLLWVSLVGYFEAERPWKVAALAGLASLSTLLAAGSRGDAAMYCVMAAGLASVVTFERSRRYAIKLALPAGLAIVAFLLFRSARQVASGVQGFGGGSGVVADVAATSPWQLAVRNFLDLPGLWAGVFGGDYGLGWLDTPIPAVVTFGGIAAFLVAGALGLQSLDIRKGIAALVLGATLWLLPVWVLTRGADPVGEQVQPRYLLPLIVLLAAVLLFTPAKRPVPTWTPSVLVPVGALLTLAHAVALFSTLRRFTTGVDVGGFNLNALVEWWWPYGPSPMVVLIGTSAAFAGLIALVVAWILTPLNDGGSHELAGPEATAEA